MKKNGRPPAVIDWSNVEKLCGIQCTEEEIASFLGISVDALYRGCRRDHQKGFAEFFRLKRGTGKVSLRRAQWTAAHKGNPTMLIWLGKQHLEQRDKTNHELSGPGGKPIETSVQLSELTDEQLEAKIQAKIQKLAVKIITPEL